MAQDLVVEPRHSNEVQRLLQHRGNDARNAAALDGFDATARVGFLSGFSVRNNRSAQARRSSADLQSIEGHEIVSHVDFGHGLFGM